jgi:hypothetical protein
MCVRDVLHRLINSFDLEATLYVRYVRKPKASVGVISIKEGATL